MSDSPLVKLAGIGIAAVLLLALMWLFALNQVTDTGALRMAAAIDESVARSLDPSAKTEVKFLREGKGVDAPRRYVVRFHPSKAVAADPAAVARTAERAAMVVAGRIENRRGVVLVHCVAGTGGGTAEWCWRVAGDAAGPGLERMETVPPVTAGSTPGEEHPR